MGDRLAHAREKFAERILDDFKGKITGNNIEYVVGQNPENLFFVGKLLSNRNDNTKSTYSSEVFIDSIGVDFYLDETDFDNAEISVYPMGDFYYRQYPSLDEQKAQLLHEVNEYRFSDKSITSFDDLLKLAVVNGRVVDEFKSVGSKLIPVYKKIALNNGPFHVKFKPSDLFDAELQYGSIPENHEINLQIESRIDELENLINEDPRKYSYVVKEKTTIEDLLDEESYDKFLKNNAKKDVCTNQNWRVYLDVTIKKIKSKYLISIALVNDSQVHSNSQTHSSMKKDDDKYSIETLFNSGLHIRLDNASFLPIELDYFKDDYKYDKTQLAVGVNCSIEYDKNTNTIITEHLPAYIQYRLLTNDKLAVSFQSLIDNPLDTLNDIAKKMYVELQNWKDYYNSQKDKITDIAKSKMRSEIEEFAREIKRFEFGINVITDYPIVQKSFVLMNQAFKNTSKKYNTWRLFQLVYIVSLIPDIVACDKDLMPEDEKQKTTLGSVSLLYFPTGGGKTEAFLGVLVFNIFFDRFRGKKCGVTSILRYPLRLLSVQQVQRLANTLAQAELLRRNEPDIARTSPFSLGYFVGDNNTPNTINKDNVIKYRTISQEEKDEERVIDICPFCGQHSVHITFDEDTHRLKHYCDNPDCPSGGVLPIYIVDQEIYRYLPTAIISTVDKLAIVGNNRNFRNILSGATHYCPKHGFTSYDKCILRDGCTENVDDFKEVNMYDPAPTLFIQDELHLIRESLGTYASHYESFVDYYVKNISPSKRKVKVIGATATISSYQTQITQLYRKDPIVFPCPSPYQDRNFYSFIDKTDKQRMILGYAPYGRAIINSVVYSLKYMREVVNQYLVDPSKILDIKDIGIDNTDDALKILEDYWIFLEYNNVKRDGNNVEGALETPINVELKQEGIKPFITRKMTGDETFQDVREVLAQVENTDDVFADLNLIVATSMISHGVDADRFNIMFFYGMPGNTAEYIQAYSRTGRKHTSIVVDIMRPSRETDQSYLKNFKKFHEYKDIMVESVPINRWATKAIDGTLPGVFTAFLLNEYCFDLQADVQNLFYMENIKKAIQKGYIDKERIRQELYESYGCVVEGTVDDLGNQYMQSINAFVDKFFVDIVDRNWEDKNIFTGFSELGYHIMNSLRDTDEQLIIELE